ncbi:hypothetical protein ACMXYN_12255 [Neptuniibacter sp. PT8_73]|uniref:hypothetical protein n=1 Tax=Neptuniibacter sp. PT8_73 TaxID=3398206 RepID=UPI0039F44E42
MVENIKLSIWDVYTNFLVGLLVLIISSLFIYLSSFFDAHRESLQVIYGNLSLGTAVLLPFVLMLVGSIIDPFSNMYCTFLKKISKYSFFAWLRVREHRDTTILKESAKKMISSNIEFKTDSDNRDTPNPYRICKAYVEQKGHTYNMQVFLARMGFYRNCSMIFLISGLVFFYVDFDIVKLIFGTVSDCLIVSNVLVFLISVFLSISFFKRSLAFKGHLEYEVFYQYITLKS